MFSATFFQIQNALIVGLMLWGLKERRKKSLHVPIMVSAIVWDVLLVLQIELSRHAIATASQVVANPMILNIHVGLAVTTVVLYAPVAYLGNQLKNGKRPEWRGTHRILGIITFVFRLLTFATSFFAHQPKVDTALVIASPCHLWHFV